jgi:hypothetical protein
MKDTGLGNKVICQLFDPIPRHPSVLAASLERTLPKVGDMVPEPDECSTVCRHCVIYHQAQHQGFQVYSSIHAADRQGSD